MKYKLMSYKLRYGMPAWPNADKIITEQKAFIPQGSPCNEWTYQIRNHVGTHMDGPNHFCNDGKKIGDLPMERFIYEKPFVLDVPKGEYEKIWKADLEPYADKIAACDLLIFRTGQHKWHDTNVEAYENRGAAVSAEAAEYLVKNFPNLKSIMMDFVSLANPSDTADGNVAHRWLLGMWTDNFIGIIEDADLHDLDAEKLKMVIGLPLIIENVDSCQVTIVGCFED